MICENCILSIHSADLHGDWTDERQQQDGGGAEKKCKMGVGVVGEIWARNRTCDQVAQKAVSVKGNAICKEMQQKYQDAHNKHLQTII